MDIVVRADQPVEVTGQGTDPKVLVGGQSFTFSGVENLSVKAASPDQVAPPPVTDDVFSPNNRPNGPVMTGIIAPKLPKSGGETAQEAVSPGVTKEVPVAELGRATQGGGPDAKAEEGFKTPGPEPVSGDTGAAPSPTMGAATGDTGPKGEPRERSAEQLQGQSGGRQSDRQQQGQGAQKGGQKGGAKKGGSKKGR